MADRGLLALQDPREDPREVRLPELDKESKRDILGHNSAKLYGLHPRHSKHYKPLPTDYPSRITDEQKRLWEMPPYNHTPNLEAKRDNFNVYRERYLALGVEPRKHPVRVDPQARSDPPPDRRRGATPRRRERHSSDLRRCCAALRSRLA
jgi:hypothetical protein